MNTNELHELAKKIAPLIGYEYPTERGWPGNFDTDGTLRDVCPRLVRKENGEIVGAITIYPIEYGHRKGRLSIELSWPNTGPERGYRTISIMSYERDRLGGGDKKTSITVAGDKSPEQVAKAIKSRLLSDVEWFYQKAAEKMKVELDYETKRKAAIDAVAELTGHKVHERDYDHTPYFHNHGNYNVKVTVNASNSFRVEIEVDTVDKVEKLLEFASRGMTYKEQST